jgi:hypothetical protein
MIVADNETAVDLLYYEAVARTVVRLVNEKSDEPLSVGVHGYWGAGKSSVLMMVEETFVEHERVLCVRFNGWLFQGYEDAKAVLIETIVDELLRRRSADAKVVDQAKKVLRRMDWMKLARKAGSSGCAISLASAGFGSWPTRSTTTSSTPKMTPAQRRPSYSFARRKTGCWSPTPFPRTGV